MSVLWREERSSPRIGRLCGVVVCTVCSAEGPCRGTKKEIIAAWNTRPVEDALAGALKFVQEHCQLYGAADAAREKIDAALRKAGVL